MTSIVGVAPVRLGHTSSEAFLDDVSVSWERVGVVFYVTIAVAVGEILELQIQKLAKQQPSMVAWPVVVDKLYDRSGRPLAKGCLELITLSVNLGPKL